MMIRMFLLAFAAPLLIAAFAPEQQGLSTPTLLLVIVAIVGVVVLRGVLLRRHMRKRRPIRRGRDASATTTSTDSKPDCGDGGSSCD